MRKQRMDDGWVSFAETRRILRGHSPQFILAAALAEKIRARVIAGRVVFDRASVEEFRTEGRLNDELVAA